MKLRTTSPRKRFVIRINPPSRIISIMPAIKPSSAITFGIPRTPAPITVPTRTAIASGNPSCFVMFIRIN